MGGFRTVRGVMGGFRNVRTDIKCYTFLEPHPRADLNDDGNFKNGGNFRNVRNVGNVRNVWNVLLYITKQYLTKYHQISNNNKSNNFQPVADIVLLYLFSFKI